MYQHTDFVGHLYICIYNIEKVGWAHIVKNPSFFFSNNFFYMYQHTDFIGLLYIYNIENVGWAHIVNNVSLPDLSYQKMWIQSTTSI